MQANGNEFDLTSSIDASTSSVDVGALSKKGIQKVNVINKNTIMKLIDEAVSRILSTKTDILSSQEKESILRQSKVELERLVEAQQLTQSKAELSEQNKNELVKELMNLHEQVRVMQNLHQDESSRRYQEGVSSQDSTIATLNDEIQLLKKQLKEREIHSDDEATIIVKIADLLKAQKEATEELKEEIRSMKEGSDDLTKAGLDEQLSRRYEEGKSSQDSIISKLREEIEALKENETRLEAVNEQTSMQLQTQRLEVEQWAVKFNSIKSLFV